MVRQSLRRARTHAAAAQMPPAAVMLLAELADAIEARVP